MSTFMVVEDEPDIYEVLLAMFEMWGIDGVAFVDGEEAISWIDDVDEGRYYGELPELALLDIRLPGNINGDVVAERLRKSSVLGDIAMAFATAYRLSTDEYDSIMKRTSADKLMYKPLPRFSELQKILDELVIQRRAKVNRRIQSGDAAAVELLERWMSEVGKTQEIEFEHKIRQDAPQLIEAMVQIDSLLRGSIHDLRAALSGLKYKNESLEKNDEFINDIEYVNLLLDCIGEARFKGSWKPEKQSFASIQLCVEHATSLIRFFRPNVDIQCKLSPNNFGFFPIDTQLFIQAISAMSIAIIDKLSPKQLQIHLLEVEEGSINLQFIARDKWRKKKSLKKLSIEQQFVNPDLLAFAAYKIMGRHGFYFISQENVIQFNLSPIIDASLQNLQRKILELVDWRELLQGEIQMTSIINTKTPLSVFIGSIVGEMVAVLTKIIERPLKDVELSTAQYCLLLARNILVIAHGEHPKLTAVNVRTVFDDLKSIRAEVFKRYAFSMRISRNTPNVIGSQLGLLQIFVNLLNNSVESMGKSGQLKFRAKPHPIGVELSISDTGQGMTKEEIDHIFDLEYSQKQGRERGIGLYVVKSLVNEYGGIVTVKSKPKNGTTFIIVLPAFD